MSSGVYIWRPASDCPEEIIVTHDERTVDPTALRNAAWIPEKTSQLFFHTGPKLDLVREAYIPNSALLPLVPLSAAKEIAELAGGDVQQIPARVVCSDGYVPCVLLNPLRAVPAVDWESTSALFIRGTKQAFKFNRLRLIDEALRGITIVRLGEYRSFLLVSERVREIFSPSLLCEFVLPTSIRP